MRRVDDIFFLALQGDPPTVDDVARPWPLFVNPATGGPISATTYDVTARRKGSGSIEVTVILQLAAAPLEAIPVEIELVFADFDGNALDSLTARCKGGPSVPLVIRGSVDPHVVAATRQVLGYLRKIV